MSIARKPRPRRLGIETLEPRQVMAASISATLDGNVLRVIGTDQDDRIVFHRSGGQITIDDVGGSWSVASLDSVQVELRGGNDYVSIRRLDGLDVTVAASADNERAKLADGRDVYFEGLGKQLEVLSGVVTLDGQQLDWFDTNLADGGVRESARNSFADSVIDRSEMIAILRGVADDGPISQIEMTSLRTLVNDDTKFGSLLYVQVLSQDIVLGNYANRHYKGKPLGNLKVGSSGNHLDKLIDKWFYGKDRPLAQYRAHKDGPYINAAYVQAKGTLFGSQIKYNDVRQGAVADCYLLASLAETAKLYSSRIRAMFIDNQDRTFTVRYFNDGRAQFVTVDLYLPVASSGRFVFANYGDSPSNSRNILWAALAEKAYAQINESGWLRPPARGGGQNSYQAISYGNEQSAMRQITGLAAQEMVLSATAGSFATIVRRYNAGQLLTFGSKKQAVHPSIVANHAYAMISYNSHKKTVTLYNPYGFVIGNGGLVTLRWSEIKRAFSDYTWGA